ncbi:hypothetical protein [Micromonospora sp. NBC_01813]|uniref:hypothetical protein n=1 Tax=Micromonospora sp. NBC_01813 TaxID=2975988 RepID=UPI002DD93ED4|nr:hypothetical protein [Micromonospora sp. NBC_01813]WSA06289.1 hypothetical protein OG958_18360 [Micromonospora sp. NBC_01813]
MRRTLRHALIIVAATVIGLGAPPAPSLAAEGDSETTVADGPGAPGKMFEQLEKASGEPVGDLGKVLAIDTGGRSLTADEQELLVAGKEVEGVKVLGAISGDRSILDTTMADLADGVYDGGGGTPTGSLLFASYIPDGREWCLTMCMAYGRSFWECVMSRRDGGPFVTLDVSGETTVGQTKAAFERANQVPVAGPSRVETLIGDGEPAAGDIEKLLDGKDVDSLRRVATVERPDPQWALADVAEHSGVTHRETTIHLFTFTVPYLGKILAVCISYDDGKTWKCTARQWGGF